MQKHNIQGDAGTLYIDSTAFDEVRFVYMPFDELKRITDKIYALPKRNSETAVLLKNFLKSAIGGDFQRIAAFAVQTGEGSFAGIRTGISLAMGMAFAMDVPVYSVDPKGEIKRITSASITDYGAAPNIGVSKRKKLKQIKKEA